MSFNGGILHGTSLTNSGSISFVSNTTSGMGLNTTLTNLASGTLNFPDGALLGADAFGGGGTFPSLINNGTINKTGTATGGFSSENGASFAVGTVLDALDRRIRQHARAFHYCWRRCR